MNFQDDDIKYEMLHWKRFEELCFDLLLKYQFYSLNWLQGGSDGGRDIEAYYNAVHPLMGPLQQRWYIECKHHTKGLGIATLSEKLELASVKQIDYFLLLTTSYLTRDTKEWLEQKSRTLCFKVDVIDGKNLKKKLLVFPELIAQYFADDTTKLVRELLRHWLSHDILPTTDTMVKLSVEVDPRKLNAEELVFLLYAFEELVLDSFEDEFEDDFSFDFLLPFVASFENRDFPVLAKEEYSGGIYDYNTAGWTHKSSNTVTKELSFHFIKAVDHGHSLEVYFCKNDGRLIDFRIGVNKTII